MRAALWIGVALSVCACAGQRAGPAPVVDRTQALAPSAIGVRDVRAGDTLFSIAWEAGKDFRELAAWNQISPPYLIQPGQSIRLSPPVDATEKSDPPARRSRDSASAPFAVKGTAEKSRTPAAPTPEPREDIHIVARGETLNRIARTKKIDVRQLAAWNNLSPPYAIVPGQKLRLTPVPVKSAASNTDKASPTASAKTENKERTPTPRKTADTVPATSTTRDEKPASAATAARSRQWAWPTEGTLLERFRPDAAMKGVDIGGKKGQPIKAAGDGQVVYQGSGLRGYGQLIILKHDADYLSAYAHCDRILVKEGDTIKRGQKIAEMGTSGTDRVKLHFEIRHRGAPVDPLLHLPKK